MKAITIHDAKTNLSKYIADAKKGDKVYIGGFGKAEVMLVAVDKRDISPKQRTFSAARGKIEAKPDAFSASTDKAVEYLLLG